VTGGSVGIEAQSGRSWRNAQYRPGDMGMTPPGDSSTLRWRGTTAHSTLQLHLPSQTLQGVYEDLSDRDGDGFEMPNLLTHTDPMIKQLMTNLAEAVRDGVPDHYAETAGELLAGHLLLRYSGLQVPRSMNRKDPRVRRVDRLMRENLGTHLSLEVMARHVGISRFHLLRLFTKTYGETPFQYFTRLRMEEAQRRLRRRAVSITEIASACGYDNPSHFTSAFHRIVGVTPREYRRGLS
jgi:AraC family transcriptional regulator